jgi:two-component system, LytTR family, sensor kinase
MLVNILPGQTKNGMEESIMTQASLSKVQSEIPLQIQSGKTKELADAYRAIANYYYRKWYNDSLLFFLRKALEQYEILNDSFHIAYCFMRIGEVFVDGDNDAESLNWTKPAASYFERNSHNQLAAHSFYMLSMAYKKMNRQNIREEYLQKARSLASISKDTLLEIIIIDQQTDQFEAEKKWDEFAAGAEHVLRLSRLIKEPVFIKKGLVNSAKVKLHLEQPLEALIFLNESAIITDGGRTQIPETFRLLVVAHLKLKQFERAEHYLRLYKQASDSIQLVKEKDSFRDMLAKYESDKKKNMIASLERENSLKEKLAANQRNLIIALFTGLVLISAAGFLYFRNLTNKRKLEKKLLLQEEELQRQKEQKLMAEFNKQLAEVQLTALNAQMNPHFIFNCMNSIQKYILKNEKTKALEFLQNFSELMRSVLDHSDKTKISLDEEINMLEKYVLLEQRRLDNKFEYQIEVDRDLQTDFFEIPGMIIQPYVENAIWHGLMNKVEPKNGSVTQNGLLKLKFSKENGAIKCLIEDNGVGRKKAAMLEKDKSPLKKSYGMAIARKRFELLQKENEKLPEIKIEDLYEDGESAGTRVTVYMNVD